MLILVYYTLELVATNSYVASSSGAYPLYSHQRMMSDAVDDQVIPAVLKEEASTCHQSELDQIDRRGSSREINCSASIRS